MDMKVFSVFLLLLCMRVLGAKYAEAQYARCINPNKRSGLCVQITECQTLYSVLKQPNLKQSTKDFIRDSSCGQSDYDSRPFVCCSSDTGYTRTRRVSPQYNNYDVDFGWDSRPNAIATPTQDRQVSFPSPSSRGFAGSSALPWGGFNQNPKFGYGSGNNFNDFGNERPSIDASSSGGSSDNALPQPPSCGGVTIQNKIYGGDDAELNEFPWMALMEYRRKDGRVGTNCAGSLVNQRYVLTAAHCVTGRIEREIGPLISVRLGEHDTTRQVDCNSRSCADAALRLSIGEARPHELYKENSANQLHDIALVRLERNVHFTDSIRPICLPSVMPFDQRRAGQMFTVAGWGRTLQSSRSSVKQKLDVEFVEPEDCKSRFSKRKVNIASTQMCAGGKFREDSCDGDSGGPLMRYRNGGWVLEGIVSFGLKCGLNGWPGVYTNVASYDDWIQSNMQG